MRGRYYHYGLGALSVGQINETPETHEAECARLQALAKEAAELRRARLLNRGKKANKD